MARVSTYLNFPRSTEEAFVFYKSVFGTEFDVNNKGQTTVLPGTENSGINGVRRD